MRQNNLFSNHFLDEKVKNSDEWEDIDEEKLSKVKEIFHEPQDLIEDLSEDEIKNRVVEPILEILGHNWESEAGSSAKKPDFLFNDQTGDYAIGEAKNWDKSLDKTSEASSNPAYQISEYLSHTDVRWGILTNGKKWRLYHAEADNLDTFYEIDLLKLVEAGSLEDFKYFYNFFRKDAFLPKDSSFLEKAYKESIKQEEI